MKTIVLSALAIFALTLNSNAQTTTASAPQTVTLNLQNQIDIAVSGTPSGLSFAFNSPDNYTNGLENLSASSFQVRSNKGYVVSVKAATADFSSSAATTMPASVLGVRINATGNSGTYAQLSTTAASLLTGQTRGTNTFTVDYKATPGFNYDAGAYTLSVVYTATQQ
ncbi:MAG: hypothetical protein ACM3VS_11480 [Candidatus Dadabacteria bacterium]